MINKVIPLFLLTCITTPVLVQASFFTEEEMNKKFTMRVSEGDCTDGQLPGEFSVFRDVTKIDCASYCDLNQDCNGYSFNDVAKNRGDCVLRSINDCNTRVPGTSKFYSKNLPGTDQSSQSNQANSANPVNKPGN
ncbi:MAG: hypothetical protein KBD64_01045 [Gammaproteobacteria bacterium]|nr:hypothetical protein [Gammaproteobacteria bacterium]